MFSMSAETKSYRVSASMGSFMSSQVFSHSSRRSKSFLSAITFREKPGRVSSIASVLSADFLPFSQLLNLCILDSLSVMGYGHFFFWFQNRKPMNAIATNIMAIAGKFASMPDLNVGLLPYCQTRTKKAINPAAAKVNLKLNGTLRSFTTSSISVQAA